MPRLEAHTVTDPGHLKALMNLFPEPSRDWLARVNTAGVILGTGLRQWVRKRAWGWAGTLAACRGPGGAQRACLAFPLSLTAHVWEEGDHPIKEEKSFQKLYLA